MKILSVSLLLSLFLCGCIAVSKEEVGYEAPPVLVDSITNALLMGLNDSDYNKSSQDFSPVLKQYLNETAFLSLRDVILNSSGYYISNSFAFSVVSQGYVGYFYNATFSEELVSVIVSFKVNSSLVEGVYFDSPNLRALSS